MQQDNGAWVYWGFPGSGFGYAGVAGLDGDFPAYQAGLDSFARPRRVEQLDTRFELGVPGRKATRIWCSKGGETAHAMLTDGTFVGWGQNNNGQVGSGDTANKTTPAAVVGVSGVTQVAGGLTHTLALLSNATVAAWGGNTNGQVGDGTTATSRPVPAVIAGLTNVVAVAAGDAHSMALLSDGTVRTWGDNSNGQLGDGTNVGRTTPGEVNGMDNAVAIAAGFRFSVALKGDGTVWAWGSNEYGVLGNGSGAAQLAPVRVGTLTSIVAVATNGQHTTFALDTIGRVWGWGRNGAGNTLLGDNRTTCPYYCTPAVITGLPYNITQIFPGGGYYTFEHAFARTGDDKIFGWGDNFYYELGIGRLDSTTARRFSTPQLVWQGLTPSDFDLDYSSDILFRNTSTGEVWLWNMREGVIAENASIGMVSTNWKITALGDLDGDGKKDIVWRNQATGENSVWFMDNRNYKGTIPLRTIADQDWQIVSTGDFNADGRADLLWRHAPAGLWAIWLIGDLGEIDARAYGGVPSNWQIMGAADFNGDGKADIIWRDSGTGAVAIYRMDGLTLSGFSFLAGGLSEWTFMAVTDLDRDGRADLLLRYYTGAALARVKLDAAGATIASGVASCDTTFPERYGVLFCPAAGGDWTIVAVGDYDADTYPDYLWRNTAGEVVVWRLVNLMLQNPAADVKYLGNPGNAWQVIGK